MIDVRSINNQFSATIQDAHGIQIKPDLSNIVILKLGLETVKVMQIDGKWTIFHNKNVRTTKVSVVESLKLDHVIL